MGCRRMSKISEASAGHWANFNSELNLPGHRPISDRLVLYHHLNEGFLLDVEQKSLHGDGTNDFSVLGRQLKDIQCH